MDEEHDGGLGDAHDGGGQVGGEDSAEGDGPGVDGAAVAGVQQHEGDGGAEEEADGDEHGGEPHAEYAEAVLGGVFRDGGGEVLCGAVGEGGDFLGAFVEFEGEFPHAVVEGDEPVGELAGAGGELFGSFGEFGGAVGKFFGAEDEALGAVGEFVEAFGKLAGTICGLVDSSTIVGVGVGELAVEFAGAIGEFGELAERIGAVGVGGGGNAVGLDGGDGGVDLVGELVGLGQVEAPHLAGKVNEEGEELLLGLGERLGGADHLVDAVADLAGAGAEFVGGVGEFGEPVGELAGSIIGGIEVGGKRLGALVEFGCAVFGGFEVVA